MPQNPQHRPVPHAGIIGMREVQGREMKWERIKGDKAEWLRCAPWIIAKAFADGHTLYILSSDEGGGTRFGHFQSADDAKRFVETLEAGAGK